MNPGRPVPLPQAAAMLGISPATLRRDIAAGAPTVEPGGRGPGCAALVDPIAVACWRGSGGRLEHIDARDRIISGLLRWFQRRPDGCETAWQAIGLSRRDAARVVLTLAESFDVSDAIEFAQIRAFATGDR